MTSQIDIDCRHYGDRELGTARQVDINGHQESTEHHRQRAVRQTTANSLATETSLSLMNKARETRERHTDKFHNSMSSLGFEPPNHGVAAEKCVLLDLGQRKVISFLPNHIEID